MYIILWVAYTNLRAPFVEVEGNLPANLANILRCPDGGECQEHFAVSMLRYKGDIESPIGRHVLQVIIPTLDYLRERCPMRLGDLFTADTLSELGVAQDSLCSDLGASDRLLDSIPFK